jgi:uncharacterized protein involved in exopolysaccharide biosynthesis
VDLLAEHGIMVSYETVRRGVSHFGPKDGRSVCRAGAEEIAALEAEVSPLRQENAELKSKLSGAPAAQPKDSSGVPSEEHFDRTLSYTKGLCGGS